MKDSPFQVGGPLMAGSKAYVSRVADSRVASHLRRMEYVTLVEPRTQGKTSLINQMIGQFSVQGYCFACRDLMAAKSSADAEASWYSSLGEWLLRQLSFTYPNGRPSLPTNSASWETYLAQIARAAEAADEKLVIVLDEIGALPAQWATPFFSVIRSVYSSRQSFSFWGCLTFVIAGAFNPKELIQDDTVSNFNVDQRIPLNDFDPLQVKQLVAHLNLDHDLTESVTRRIHYWTDGQPYLTQRLCLYLSETSNGISLPEAEVVVDRSVDRFFREDTHHLSRVKSLASHRDLLAYTRRIASEPRSRFNAALNDNHFYLAHIAGIIKADAEGRCRIRNRIYERALGEIECLPRLRPGTTLPSQPAQGTGSSVAPQEGKIDSVSRTGANSIDDEATKRLEVASPEPALGAVVGGAALAFAVGVLGNLVAAWIQQDVLGNAFTPTRIAVILALTLVGLVASGWMQRRAVREWVRNNRRLGLVALAMILVIILSAMAAWLASVFAS